MPKPERSDTARAASSKKKTGDKDPELVALGKRLFALREAADLTQEALAHAAGLHWTYVGQVERGERNLSYKNVLRLAKGLGVAPARLMQDD